MWSFDFAQFDHHDRVSKFLLTVFFSLIIFYLFKRAWEIFRLPPGPYGLPILGYLPFLKENKTEQYIRLGRKYGSPFSIHLGKYDFIIINDWYHANEAYNNEELLDRPPEGILGGLLADRSVVDLSGQAWKDQIRFFLHLLRDFGLGKSELEEKIKEEIETFVNELDKKREKPFNISSLLSASVSNNISLLTHGKRFEYDDKERRKLLHYIQEASGNATFLGLATAMPFLVKALRFLGSQKYKVFMEALTSPNGFNEVKMDKNCGQKYEPISDYVDRFLEKMEELEQKGLPQGSFNFSVLKANIVALFAAGSTTIFSTMSWLILLLVKYPHYQSKIREEISQIIGSRTAFYEDRFSLPFTMAFIYETLRYRTNVHLALPRYGNKDIRVGDCLIPKGTRFIVNSYAIDHDPILWSDPDKFYPERFLSEDRKKNVLPAHFIPFGGGKRKCIGESMAMVSLFQYLTSIVQKYSLGSHEGPDKVCDKPKNGYVSFPAHMPRITVQLVQ
ncbi:cytochrome P450 2A8-like [Brevipalpus obovatus]|uniref:cytochrome P450 2A8-like n=1 Tax=Brevipalpus obovatus TaxID=246614 RepID=UPI003D9E4A59